MKEKKDKVQLCERCHQRKATSAAVTSFKGGDAKISFEHLCAECLEAISAENPKSLQEMLDQMEEKLKQDEK